MRVTLDVAKKCLLLFSGYTALLLLVRSLGLSVLTYILSFGRSGLYEISDVFGSNEILLSSTSACIFIFIAVRLFPSNEVQWREIFDGPRFQRNFMPGFLKGSFLALLFVLGWILVGAYRNFGILITFNEATAALALVLARTASIILVTYVEEYIFRAKILSWLMQIFSRLGAAVLVSALYCMAKGLQYDLGLKQWLTLFLVSMTLSVQVSRGSHFSKTAGLLAGFLVVFHPVCSLPIFGNEYQGIFLIKFQNDPEIDASLLKTLSGGASGPIASLLLQAAVAIDILRRMGIQSLRPLASKK